MTTRWDVERALRGSGLPSAARHVALELLTRTEAGTAEVPAEHSPSLTGLARDTGMSRRAVMDGLNVLESGGWVTRLRDLKRAVKEHQPTGYRLHVPARAGGALGQEVPQPARAPVALGLGQETTRARAPVAPIQTYPDLVRPARARGRGPADIIRAVYPSATDDEIEILIKDREDHGARSVVAVLDYEIRESTLRLPCDRSSSYDGVQPHSQACRDGDPGRCGMDWCACRCHTEPTPPGPATATPPQEGTTP